MRFRLASDVSGLATPTNADVLFGDAGSNTLYGYGGDDTLYGYGGDDLLYGGIGNDRLEGGAGHDDLYGGDGNDVLRGGAGLDGLNGGDGNDILIGGGHSDYMRGGAGADRFVFTPDDIRLQDDWGNAILDFSHAAGDRIDFARLIGMSGESGHFTFIGTGAFTGAGNEVRYEVVGGVTIVQVDVRNIGDWDYGNGAELSIEMNGTHQLVASDFVL